MKCIYNFFFNAFEVYVCTIICRLVERFKLQITYCTIMSICNNVEEYFLLFCLKLRNYWSLYYEQFWGKILSPNFFKICVDCLIWCKVWLTQVKETWNGLLFTGKCLFCSQKVLLFVILDLYIYINVIYIYNDCFQYKDIHMHLYLIEIKINQHF